MSVQKDKKRVLSFAYLTYKLKYITVNSTQKQQGFDTYIIMLI